MYFGSSVFRAAVLLIVATTVYLIGSSNPPSTLTSTLLSPVPPTSAHSEPRGRQSVYRK
jgi:hypothetical protein